MRKNSAKVRKKKLARNSANFAQQIYPFRGNPTCNIIIAVICIVSNKKISFKS